MKFQVLGSLCVDGADGSVDLGSYKQRSLLGLLLVHRNQVVPLDRILDELWGEDTAVDRKGALHVYVSNLRTALEPDRARRSEGSYLLTRAPGYVLVTDDSAVDADEFEDAVRQGRVLADTDPAAGSIVIGEALAVWRGLPYQDFTYERWAQAEIERLTELRLSAVETRLEADLDRGLSGELVSELGSLVREYPLRERLSGQLMLALYRSGRQAEALRAYHALSERLADELGITPSTELRRLEERLVMADPDLMVIRTASPGSVDLVTRTVRGYELREELGRVDGIVTFRAYQASVGRQVALKEIGSDLADDPDFVRRFEDDARRVSHLRSDHVVPIYDYWREPGAAYLVGRLMLGGTLGDRLDGTPMERDAIVGVVEAVGDALGAAHRAGLAHGDLRPSNVFFDSDGIAFVADFRIGAAATVPIRSGAGTRVPEDPAAEDQAALGACIAQAVAGREGLPAELMVGMEPDIAAVLGRATGPLADRYPDVVAFADAALAVLADGAGGTSRERTALNPYKGLRAFQRTDAEDFFGRDREIERLVAHIADPQRASRFVAVVGPSGSGKSSLVKAGLIPALHRGAAPGSRAWFVVEMVPGRYPFEALEEALLGVAFDPPTSMLPLLTGDDGITRTVDRILPDDDSQLVLVVDQLEELFTHTDPTTAKLFLARVAAAVSDPRSRVRVVCTIRADFYDRPLLHPAFGELLRRGTEVITPMSPSGLEQAITGPAQRVGVNVDQAIVAEIVADVVERPAALPLMQYALTEMFDVRERNVIPAGAYHQVGGVLGALVQRAEGTFATLDEESKAATRQVFLRLVTLGDRGEQDTRRRALTTELTALGTWGGSVQSVLDVYGHHRLLTFDRDLVTRSPSVEISHEALLTEWSRLKGWIEDARSDVKQQRRLAAALSEWQESGESHDYLLGGGVLDQMEVWAATSEIYLTDAERRFLDASIDRRDAIEANFRVAEQEHRATVRRSRRRARMLAVLGVAAILIGTLAVYAWVQRNDAHRLAERTQLLEESARLADSAVRQSTTDAELSTLLALSAADASIGLEELPVVVEEAMHMAYQSSGITYPSDVEIVQTAVTPYGVRGYYTLAGGELASTMQRNLRRGFTDDECARFGVDPCPTSAGDVIDPAALPPLVDRPPGTLAGTAVAVVEAGTGGLALELAAFSEKMGINAELLPGNNVHEYVGLSWVGGQVDVAVWPQPANVQQMDSAQGLVDVSTYLGDLSPVYGDYLLDLVTSKENRLLGIPIDVDLKGMIFYPPQRFAEASLSAPTEFEEAIDLSNDIVSLGGAPWCIGLADNEVDGWIATDWIEDLVLAHAGVEVYDAWVAHEIPFDHPDIVDALVRFDSLLAGDGYVPFGRGAVAETPWWTWVFTMFNEDGAACWMHHSADGLPPGFAPFDDLDFFMLGAVGDAERGVLGGGNFASTLTDRPEVRELMRFLSGPEYGNAWAAQGWGFLSPRQGFDPAKYGPEDDPAANIKRAASAIVLDALAREVWRFDASDLMPAAIGSDTEDGDGAFYSMMMALARDDLSPQEAAERIEAAWVELETTLAGP